MADNDVTIYEENFALLLASDMAKVLAPTRANNKGLVAEQAQVPYPRDPNPDVRRMGEGSQGMYEDSFVVWRLYLDRGAGEIPKLSRTFQTHVEAVAVGQDLLGRFQITDFHVRAVDVYKCTEQQ